MTSSVLMVNMQLGEFEKRSNCDLQWLWSVILQYNKVNWITILHQLCQLSGFFFGPIHQLCVDTAYHLKDLLSVMADKNGRQERLKAIHAVSLLWWWWLRQCFSLYTFIIQNLFFGILQSKNINHLVLLMKAFREDQLLTPRKSCDADKASGILSQSRYGNWPPFLRIFSKSRKK